MAATPDMRLTEGRESARATYFELCFLLLPSPRVFFFIVHCRDITLRGFWVNQFLGSLAQQGDDKLKAFLDQLVDLMKSGVIEPFVGEKYDLAEFVTALKKQAVEGRGGKILLSG